MEESKKIRKLDGKNVFDHYLIIVILGLIGLIVYDNFLIGKLFNAISDEVTMLLNKITNDLAYKFALSQLIDEGIAFDSNTTPNRKKSFTTEQLESKISALFGKDYKFTYHIAPTYSVCGGTCDPVHIMIKVTKAVKDNTSITLTVKAIFPKEVSGTVIYYADYLKTKKLELRLYDYVLNYEDSNFKDASTYKIVFTLEDGNYYLHQVSQFNK